MPNGDKTRLDTFLKSKKRFLDHFEPRDLTANKEDYLKRVEAIKNGQPAILIISTARSASSGISNQLSFLTNSPRVFIDAQDTPIEHDIAAGLLYDFVRGGAITYVHSRPSTRNINAINDSGLKKFILHIRDPRQCLISNYWRMHGLGGWRDRRIYYNNIPLNYENMTFSQQIDWHIENVYQYYWINWIEEWLTALDSGKCSAKIKLTTYESFHQDPINFIVDIGRYFGFNWKNMSSGDLLGAKPTPPAKYNGDTDSWRKVLTANQIGRLQELTPNSIIDRFRWPK